MKKNGRLLLFFVLISLFSISHVFAYSSKLKFCEYGGVLRAFKILGIIFYILKLVIPIVLIIVTVINTGKGVFTGKEEDLKEIFPVFIRRFIACVLIFITPSMLNIIFNSLVFVNDSQYKACTVCAFDLKNCEIKDANAVPDYSK